MSGQRRVDFDIAIVGGGIVGPAVAGLLAANERTAQWRVALIERNEPRPPDAGRIDLRVSAISRASQRILQVAGAWAAVATDAAPYSDMVVWDATSRHDGADALPPAKDALARLSVGAAGRVPRLARGVPLAARDR